MANKLRQLGDLPGQGTALAAPEDNEAEALKEKQANVDAVAAPYAVAPAVAPVAYPPIDPNAQYGNRPGEQRIDVSNMITPLGSARAQGGPVEPSKPYVVGEQGPEVIVPKEKGTVIPSAHYVQGESPKRPVPQELGSAMYNPAQDEANSAVVQQQTQQALQNQLLNSPMAMPMRAEGGDIEADQPTLVGEEGPEVVAPEGGAPDTASGTPSAKPFGGVEPESKPTDPLKLAADQHANQAKDVAQQRATIHEDKKAAASKGDLIGLGMAKIHENELNKSEVERSVLQEATAIPKPVANGSLEDAQRFVAGLPGTATPEHRKASAGIAPVSPEGLPTSSRINPGLTESAPNAGGLPTSSNTNPGLGSAMVSEPTPETEHSSLEQKRAALKQTMAGPDTEAAGVATRQLAELNKQNPWGTAGNHPGGFGKVMHGLAKAGNIAGDIAIPGVMANIPGSERNLDKQVGEGMAEEAQGAAVNKEDAQAKAAGVKTPDEGKTITTDKGIMQFDTKTNRYDIPAGQPVETAGKTITTDQGIMQWNPETRKYDIPVGGAPAGHENDKSKYLDQYYKDNPNIPRTAESMQVPLKEFAKANQGDPQMLLMEPGSGGTQTAVKVAPGTTTSSNAAKPGESAKEAGKNYLYTDETGTTHMTTGDKVPLDAEKIPVKDPQVLMALAHSSNIVQESLNKLHKDVDEHPELFDSAKTRAILATALDDERAKSIGMLVAGTGGNLTMPAGVNKIIDTFLENNAVKGTEKTALQNYIADYWNMRDKAMVQQMAMQGGKIGRGSQAAMQNIIDQLPGGRTASSDMARRQLAGVQQTQTELSSNYPDKYENFTKVKPYERKKTSTTGVPTVHKVGGTITQGGKTYTVTSVDENGKVTGAK